MHFVNGYALLDPPVLSAVGRAPTITEALAFARAVGRSLVAEKKSDEKSEAQLQREAEEFELNELLKGKRAQEAREPTPELADDNVSASHDANTYSEGLDQTPMSQLMPSADDGDKQDKAYKCNECGSALDVYKGSESAQKLGTGFCPKCHERRLLQK